MPTPAPSTSSSGTAWSPAAPSSANGSPGGFAGVYKVLSAFEDTGRCRRGYFIEGLGAAQFGSAGAIDRLRTFAEPDSAEPGTKPTVVALAATDPANVFGAALPWPDAGDPERTGHRPGRKAGALVVLVDGALTVYVERGGRTLLTWNDDLDVLTPAMAALADAARRGRSAGSPSRRPTARR